MLDYILILVRFFIVYGLAWFILARRLARYDIFERIAITVVVAHFGAYAIFLLHFLLKWFYLPVPTLFFYGLFCYFIKWLMLHFEISDANENQARLQSKERFIWTAFIVSFFILFFVFSFREGGNGGMYNTYLDLWRFNQETALAYPDLKQMGYKLAFSPLFFSPLFYSNALLLTCGINDINAAVSGFGVVQFSSFLGVLALIHLLLKEVSGDNKLSYVALLFFATWRFHGAHSYHFSPDHNSFVGFFTLGGIYFLIRYCRRFSLKDLWLFLAALILGINNRPWLVGFFAGFSLSFIDRFFQNTWIGRRQLFNWKTLTLFILLLFIGSCWITGIFQFGNTGNPYGVYQRTLEKNYGAGDMGHYYSIQRFFAGAPEIFAQIKDHIFENFFQARQGYALPLYLTLLGLLGLGLYVWRFRGQSTTWRFVTGLFLAIYLSGFISPPTYPRGHLWLISVLLLFAALFFNEGYRLILRYHWKIPNAIKFMAIIYLVYFGLSGLKNFSEDIYSLAVKKTNIEDYAKSVQSVKPPGTKTLHLSFEPGADLDAFMKNEYWWKNYHFFPGVMGEETFEAVFPAYKAGAGIDPCVFIKRDITVIDVTFRPETLFKRLNWTKEQYFVIEKIIEWLKCYPDIFPLIAEGAAGRKAYAVKHVLLRKKFMCDTREK